MIRHKYLAVEPNTVVSKIRANGDGSGGAEVIRVESDANAVVDGENPVLVAFPPILNDGNVGGRLRGEREEPFIGCDSPARIPTDDRI